MEPIVAFFLLHPILIFLMVFIFGISRIKKLERFKTSLEKANVLILLLYVAFHLFCFCVIFLSIFVSSISTTFWLVFYLKFLIAMGLFAGFACVVGIFLMPFGLFAITLNSIKNLIKS